MNQLSKYKRLWVIALCFYGALLLAHSNVPIVWAEQTKEEKAHQRMLNLEAANAFWRLKRALEKEGFYSGRVRLNVWRAAAMDAGKFDPQKYEEFKQQLYQKSVNDSLTCFELYIEENSPHDAKMCLQTWKVHATVIDQFDEDTYNELVQRLENLKNNPPPPSAE